MNKTSTQPYYPYLNPNDQMYRKTVTLKSDVQRLYKAANRIANLEYELNRITAQRDDLIEILKRTMEKL